MKRRQRRGTVLLAIFFLIVLNFLALALLDLLPLELRSAGRNRLETAAFLAADSGVLHALVYIEDRVSRGDTPLPNDAASHTLHGKSGSWDWKATLKADPDTPPLGKNTIRVYEIDSQASLDGVAYRAVRALARQETFARYAWFEDQRKSDLVIPGTSYHFDGPFHSNSRIRILVPPDIYNQNRPPIFESEVTTVESYDTPDGVAYQGPPPYDAQGNPIQERYQKIYRGGRESLRTGVRRIELPTDSGSLSSAAQGQSPVTPSTRGVHLGLKTGSNDLSGGLTVVGDVDSMLLDVEEDGNRSVTIQQGSSTTKVLELTDTATTAPNGNPVPQGSTILYKPDGTFSVHTGLTNGLIYGTGNIRGLRGINKGKRTVAVDMAAQKEIVLGGALTRADTPVGQAPQSGRDALGLVAFKVRVPTSIARTVNPPTDVYAAILAGTKGSEGGFYIDSWSSRPPGRIRLFGGLMMGYKPTWLSVDSIDGSIISGVALDSTYDQNLSSSPPPYFPTIGKFRILRYQEEAPSVD